MQPHLEARLAVLLEASMEAGRTFADRLEADKEVTAKTSAADVVTEVDKACEHLIRSCVGQAFPGDAILGEEGVAPGREAAKTAVMEVLTLQHVWIVDPLDGTTNFVHRIPLSVVSLAYAEAGTVMLGAVYDPYRDELFVAVREEGAYCIRGALLEDLSKRVTAQQATPSELWALVTEHGTRLRVSSAPAIRGAILASGFPTRGDDPEQSFRAGMEIVRMAKSARAMGAAALHLAWVAAGRLDGFWEYDLNAWDVSAGALLVEEAGGVRTDVSGKDFTVDVRDIVACGQASLAAEIRQVLGDMGKRRNQQ